MEQLMEDANFYCSVKLWISVWPISETCMHKEVTYLEMETSTLLKVMECYSGCIEMAINMQHTFWIREWQFKTGGRWVIVLLKLLNLSLLLKRNTSFKNIISRFSSSQNTCSHRFYYWWIRLDWIGFVHCLKLKYAEPFRSKLLFPKKTCKTHSLCFAVPASLKYI